jgi:uncharacterized protein YcbX
MATVLQCWRYPVKSMLGEVVDTVTIGPLGIEGDRTWATRDLVRGGIRGAKKIGGLMSLAARNDPAGGAPVITLPDGTAFAADDPDADVRVSAALGHPVRLEPLAPIDDLEHYRRGPSDPGLDPMAGLREVFALEPDEPLPDLTVFPSVIAEFESPPGTYYDCYPLVLQSTSSLALMRSLVPDGTVDVRRFRPSLLVDTGDGPGLPENDWVGHRVRIGTAVVSVHSPAPRCVMITRGFADVPEDRRMMRAVVRGAGHALGVYAVVVEPGVVRAGDPIEVLTD